MPNPSSEALAQTTERGASDGARASRWDRAGGRLHGQVTRTLALRVIRSGRENKVLSFPKEAELCEELGVSRSILRESMKVLTDKGMIEMKPRAGTRSRPRGEWRLLDPDILCWQAAVGADRQFLKDLCEVRLAIEPTAAGFAAVRATAEEIGELRRLLGEQRGLRPNAGRDQRIELNLRFQAAVVAASHSPMLIQLSASIREPFRVALRAVAPSSAATRLSLDLHETLIEALANQNPLAARRIADEVVGLAMISAEGEGTAAGSSKERHAFHRRPTI